MEVAKQLCQNTLETLPEKLQAGVEFFWNFAKLGSVNANRIIHTHSKCIHLGASIIVPTGKRKWDVIDRMCALPTPKSRSFV